MANPNFEKSYLLVRKLSDGTKIYFFGKQGVYVEKWGNLWCFRVYFRKKGDYRERIKPFCADLRRKRKIEFYDLFRLALKYQIDYASVAKMPEITKEIKEI